MIAYRFEIAGCNLDGQTWEHKGRIDTEGEAQFLQVPQEALRLAFIAITEGKAVFGQPGKGCRGPYRVTKLLVERVEP